MVVYNLDETPGVFITPKYYDNEFEYRMEEIIGEDDRKTIGHVNLRSDKLVIYGSEVKESMFKRLYESLVMRRKSCSMCVNCSGACYIPMAGKTYLPLCNVIFDWSSFGVVVPSSMNESLKKQVQELEKTVEKSNKEAELARIEVESTKASLKASIDEANELKKVQNELGLNVQKAFEKVALIDFELELYKIELESCKKELNEVLDDLCSCKEDKGKMEMEICAIRDQLSSEISSFNKRNVDLDMKSKLLENELSLTQSELHTTKNQLKLSDENVKQLENQLSTFKNKYEDMKEELEKVQDQFSMASKEVEELKDQIRCYEKENQCIELQMQKMINHVKLINLEVKSSNQRLDQLLISNVWKKLNNISKIPSNAEIMVAHDIKINQGNVD